VSVLAAASVAECCQQPVLPKPVLPAASVAKAYWQQPVLAAASVFCHHLRERIGSSQ